MAYVIGY